MYRQLLAFEWAFHTRQISFYLALLIATVMGALLATGLYGGAQVKLNAPAQLNFVASFFSMASIFVLMVTCANAMLRDSDSKMTELVYVTPLTKWQLLSSRFFGAFAAAFVIMTCAMIGAVFGLNLPWIDPQNVAPINLYHYLWNLVVMMMPSMLFAGILIFAVAALTRSTIATYLGAAMLYVLYLIIAGAGGSPMFVGSTPPSPEAFAWAARLDPFGITAYFEQTQYWTTQQKNSQLMSLEGNFLFNRILVLSLFVLLLLALNAVYKLQLPKQKKGKTKGLVALPSKTLVYRVMETCKGSAAARAAWWSSLKMELSLLLKSKPFIAMIVMYSVLVLMELRNMTIGIEFGPKSFPSTALLLNGFMYDVLPRFGAIFIIYYAAEIFWRDRNAKFNAFIDCSPVSNTTLCTTKFLALLMVPVSMCICSVAMAILLQIAMGYSQFEPLLYLSVFYYAGLPLVFVAVLALFMQTISRNKYLGMIFTAMFLLATGGSIATWLGLEHPLWQFGQTPELDYTDMNGYGIGGDAFGWFVVYWGAFCGLLMLLGFALWPRGAEQSLRFRGKGLHQAKLGSAASVAVMLLSGSYIFYQTNVANAYQSSADFQQKQADYELAYKHYEPMVKPRITEINLKAALYPENRQYQIEGWFTLTNQTHQPIERLLLSAVWGLTQTKVTVDAAKSVQYDEDLRVYLFELEQPLLPGESIDMNVELSAKQSGFVGTSFRNTIIENGSYITLNSIMPMLGYRAGREIQRNHTRAEYGLPKQEPNETLHQAMVRKGGDFSDEFDWVNFEAQISTAADQTIVTQGNLLGQWQDNGRNVFHYKSAGQIRNVIAFHSGRYTIEKVDHNGVSIEVYFHPDHHYNVAHMVDAVKTSLDYFSDHFAPYPHNHLRITEVLVGKNSRQTGFASTGNMLITNHGGFLADMNSDYDVDQVYRRIAHEVAHQWWGYQLDPAFVPGSLTMVETLAKYSEMRILEGKYGKAHVRDLIAYESRRYLRGRANQNKAELPLYEAEGDQGHLFYSKGGYAMYHLTELLGEQTMNKALASFIEQFAYPKAMPTSLDLLDVLYSVAPAATHNKINELFKQVMIYDLRIASATYSALEDGRYSVEVKLNNAKFEADGLGSQTEIAMKEQVEVAIYSAYPAGLQAQSAQVLAAKVEVQEGAQTLQFIVDKAPKYIAIDPNYLFIDRNRENNWVMLESN